MFRAGEHDRCVFVCVRACRCPWAGARVCVCVRARACMRVRAQMFVCARACVCVRANAHVCVSERAGIAAGYVRACSALAVNVRYDMI